MKHNNSQHVQKINTQDQMTFQEIYLPKNNARFKTNRIKTKQSSKNFIAIVSHKVTENNALLGKL